MRRWFGTAGAAGRWRAIGRNSVGLRWRANWKHRMRTYIVQGGALLGLWWRKAPAPPDRAAMLNINSKMQACGRAREPQIKA